MNAGAGRILESHQNAATVAALFADGSLGWEADEREPALAHEVVSAPVFIPPSGEINRLALAAMGQQAVIGIARRLQIEVTGRRIDDVRLDVAEELFG